MTNLIVSCLRSLLRNHLMFIFRVPSHPIFPHRLDVDVAAQRRFPDIGDRQRREEVRRQVGGRRLRQLGVLVGLVEVLESNQDLVVAVVTERNPE